MLSDREIRLALYCAGEELRARHAGKPPGPAQWLHSLVRALESELAASQLRQWPPFDGADSRHDDIVEIGTAEVARLLGWPRRKVQRRVQDLGGRLVAGRYLFSHNEIRQLAEDMTDARDSARDTGQVA